MAIFYHGSSVLFDRFDLTHALEGDGKIKFGYGVYLTGSFRSAAHYSGSNKNAISHYVYTVEVPELKDDNHLCFRQPVHPDIVRRAENKLGVTIPPKIILDGKDFRKYIAGYFEQQINWNLVEVHPSAKELHLAGEKSASGFLTGIGVDFITWPYNWKNPDSGMNVAVLDDKKIRIIKIHQVELDDKQQLIAGSEREVLL